MEILTDNVSWMIYNLYLAVLPMIFSLFLFKMPNKWMTYFVAALWLLYLPNTIYVFTDLQHLVEQWSQVGSIEKIVLLIQYAILEVIGLACFLIAFHPWEKILQKYTVSNRQFIFGLIGINFLIGFAMVLGRIERVNSWDVLLNPLWVITSSWHVLTSYQMLGLTILFGIFSNLFYFLFRDKARKLYMRWVQ
jgi:uncharacterized membrane protein